MLDGMALYQFLMRPIASVERYVCWAWASRTAMAVTLTMLLTSQPC